MLLLAYWRRFLAWVRGNPSPPEALPPIQWMDTDGVGWRETPDYQEPHYPDRGQHETWKREMRVLAWRWRNGMIEGGKIDLYPVGLSTAPKLLHFGVLFPLDAGLAGACRRLGFRPLLQAAMPEMQEAERLALYNVVIQETEKEIARRVAYERPNGLPSLKESDVRPEVEATIHPGPFEPPPLSGGKVRAPLQPTSILEGEQDFRDFVRHGKKQASK